MELQPTSDQVAAATRLRKDLAELLGDRGYVVTLEDLDPSVARTVALAVGSVDASCISGSVPLEQDPKRSKAFLIFPRS